MFFKKFTEAKLRLFLLRNILWALDFVKFDQWIVLVAELGIIVEAVCLIVRLLLVLSETSTSLSCDIFSLCFLAIMMISLQV